MKVVLIIDNDLGFVVWLGQTLDHGGYEALPAKGTSDAMSVLSELKRQVDLLIVNPALPGITQFIERLRQSRKQLKVIAVSADEEPALPGSDAVRRKPAVVDEAARREWLEFVQGTIQDPPKRAGTAG